MSSKQSNDTPKTSKTARVMNLLSKKPDASAADAPESPMEQPSIPAAGKPAAVPPILSSIGSDAAVSGQIKNALEDALEAELSPSKPAKTAAPAPQPAAASAPAEAPARQSAAVPAPAEPEPPRQPAAPQPEASSYINVMQVLVEEKAPKYIKMLGVCECPRCAEDVKALALNHLPPKYVVMDHGDMIPRLTYYEGKFNSDIITQLVAACQAVQKTPHHNR